MTTNLSKYLINEEAGTLSRLVVMKGHDNLSQLINYVRQLPYGRNQSRDNLELVITEEKGTCSSKHAFIAEVAREQGFDFIQLVLCIYSMDKHNTPNIGATLDNTGIASLPEAHCYVQLGEMALDLTFPDSDMARLEPYILEKKTITPNMVGTYKVDYHQSFIKKWTFEAYPDRDWSEIWSLREACISELESNR